jgi:hypothetical protein
VRPKWTARTIAIVTTTPNELCAELHNRMPVVLGPDTCLAWLGEEPADAPQLKAMLAPYPSEEMTCWPVNTRVGNVKNNDPSLIEPISAQMTLPRSLAMVLILLALGGCAQMATGRDSRHMVAMGDIRATGAVMAAEEMVVSACSTLNRTSPDRCTEARGLCGCQVANERETAVKQALRQGRQKPWSASTRNY